MKLKYYMRGLGIGIVVTAIVMSAFGKEQVRELSSSEIKEKAKAIGMIESTVLADISEKNLEELKDNKSTSENAIAKTQKATAENAVPKTQKTTPEDTKEAINEDAQKAVPEDKKVVAENGKEILVKDTAKDIAKETKEDTTKKDIVTPTTKDAATTPSVITVRGGDGSLSVSRKLVEAGLVESATEYDAYLCKNGYDKKIASGNHSIPSNATPEEIAKIITNSR